MSYKLVLHVTTVLINKMIVVIAWPVALVDYLIVTFGLSINFFRLNLLLIIVYIHIGVSSVLRLNEKIDFFFMLSIFTMLSHVFFLFTVFSLLATSLIISSACI